MGHAASHGTRRGTRADAVYVAFDADVLDPGSCRSFMPVAGGPTVAEAETLLREVASSAPLAGFGLTGVVPDTDVATLTRLVAAVGL